MTSVNTATKNKMSKAEDQAAFLIAYSAKQSCPISNLKLQKLLYFAQCYALISENRKLFEEPIEAWAFGPVVSDVYILYKQYGGANILGPARNTEPISKKDRQILIAVFDKFRNWSATDLTQLTLNQRPWQDAYAEGRKNEIPVSSIKSFFSKEG